MEVRCNAGMTDARIDSLRGLACVLLVAYHVVGPDPDHGLRVADGAIRWMNDALATLRMPLFTFLSGLVYGLRPFAGDSRAFLFGKSRRLLVPMLVVGTLFAVLQAITPGTNSTVNAWYLLHIQPVAHFWFVESLFLIFLVVWALERGNLMASGKGLGAVLAVSCALYLLVRGWSWLGIEGAIYLMPYFLTGLYCSRFPTTVHLSKPWVTFALVAIAIGSAYAIGPPVPNADRRTVAMLLAGICLCLLCLRSNLQLAWLARIGQYSYPIYLWHIFFTAASRIALHRVGVEHLLVDLLMGLLLGLAGPVLIERTFSGSRLLAPLLLGKSVKGAR